MKPVDLEAEGFENVIVIAKDQPEYERLPAVQIEPGLIWTKWQLSETERRAIMDGASVELWVWTFGKPLQPLALTVEGTSEDDGQPTPGRD